ncbi:hypothetical protein AWM68_13365 [Fictibacillus phosphorivorans]|uniref:ABC transporter domain-containing protein n=1 Tax=Fictibacillus phosphorivorans TaxID=1221500 RepID=A0A165MZZ5_9BACL|nr:ATP-binding cassette domain-containing protein [Fictibacillus phosphorivorans]KZE64090.1 hypothetical protein AWM68_13365 [Fictibacillus phosphorivorans]
MEPIVKLQNISKKYSLYRKNSDKLMELFSFKKKKDRSFFAVRNISFEANKGETIGIIGINGSGKSTLSNLLAQVVPPTSGEMRMNGEPSLIAISAGLNNQLSGMENIQLKCLMHGMKKSEIEEVISAIIDFADIGSFINQPVKNYSSGMKSRLGFAISVHTNPDILIVDEALSVGDQTFYDKCLKKMDEFKQQGKTIFFISHSTSQIQSFCDKVLWMHFGEVREFNETREVIKNYKSFIKWFNALDDKEKKRYKEENLHKQQTKQPDMSSSRMYTQKSKRKMSKTKKWGSFLTSLQIATLFILVVSAASLMLSNGNVQALVNDLLVKQGSKEEAPKKKILIQKEINHIGQVQEASAFVYKDNKKSEKIGELKFTDSVFVEEQYNNLFKVKYDEVTGYTEKKNIAITDNEKPNQLAAFSDFFPLTPETFDTSYEFFFSQIGSNYDEVKEKLRGLTEETTTKDGLKQLHYGYDNFIYRFNESGTVDTIITTNVEETQDINAISELALLKSNNQSLFYFLMKDYEVYLDFNEKTITFKKLS